MTVKDIIIVALKSIGADGLFNRDVGCGCNLDDLPCEFECNICDCEPAHRKIATAEDTDNESDYEIGDEIYVPMEELKK